MLSKDVPKRAATIFRQEARAYDVLVVRYIHHQYPAWPQVFAPGAAYLSWVGQKGKSAGAGRCIEPSLWNQTFSSFLNRVLLMFPFLFLYLPFFPVPELTKYRFCSWLAFSQGLLPSDDKHLLGRTKNGWRGTRVHDGSGRNDYSTTRLAILESWKLPWW